MSFEFYSVFIYASILGLQYFLSTRRSVYWGVLLPILFALWGVWMLINFKHNTLSFSLLIIVGLAFLLGGWRTGREQVHENHSA